MADNPNADPKASTKADTPHQSPLRDPRDRLGAVLAQSDAQRAATRELKDALKSDTGDPLFPLPANSDSKLWIVIMLVGLAAAAAVAIVRFLR